MVLLEHSAQINPQDIAGNTPLHFTCNNGHMDAALLLLIVSQSALAELVWSSQGGSVLYIAAHCKLVWSSCLLWISVVLILCSHGSCMSCNHCILCCPLQHGADVSLANNRGDTPLHNAAGWNHPMLVNELLLYGALYTVTNNNGKTHGPHNREFCCIGTVM